MPTSDQSTAAGLSASLLGPFEVRVNGAAIAPLHSCKEQWLFALLALRSRKPVDRKWLAGTLWPDATEERALAYLRRSLYLLRTALGPEADRLGAPSPRTLLLDLSGASVDVRQFDTAVERGDLPSLAEAVRLYRGRLLENCTEEWALDEQRRREENVLQALEKLADAALERGEPAEAIPYLRRLVALDPLREHAYRLLMRALTGTGAHGAMVQVYRDLRLLLRSEVNADPAPETARLYAELRATAPTQTVPDHRHQERAAPEPPGRVPVPLTPIIGREDDLRTALDMLGAAPLVTLTGPGGVGKTRLALEIARAWQQGHVWCVELASAAEGVQVAQAVVSAMGLRDRPGTPAEEALIEALSGPPTLLVMDNCEHLVDQCAAVACRLLQRCPGLRILATSRQPLAIAGEAIFTVQPLDVPRLPAETGPSDHRADAALVPIIEQYPAVRLFAERAHAAQQAFALTTGNARDVAAICSRLDGIPLAIELAAAWVRTLAPHQILARLTDRFRLLGRGLRSALPHHQALRALVDWSYDTLGPRERRLLARLAVFAGGWTMGLAEAVCPSDGEPAAADAACIERDDVVDLLTALVDRSLVQTDPVGPEPRFRYLETVREYAAARLDESGERAAVQERFCSAVLEWCERNTDDLRGVRQAEALREFDAEHDNLRAALELSTSGPGYPDTALRLCAAAGNFWVYGGHIREGCEWCRRALEHPAAQSPTASRARALRSAGTLAWVLGTIEDAVTLQTESLAIHRQTGDQRGVASALERLGVLFTARGDPGEARRLLGEAADLAREVDDPATLTNALVNLGCAAEEQGDLESAREAWLEALKLARGRGDRVGAALALSNVGGLAERREDWREAQRLYGESLALMRAVGDTGGIAVAAYNSGCAAVLLGEFDKAGCLMKEALTLWRGRCDPSRMIVGVEGLAFNAAARLAAGQAADRGAARAATRLLAALEPARTAHRCPRSPGSETDLRRWIPVLNAALGPEDFDTCCTEGAALTLEEAVDRALNSL